MPSGYTSTLYDGDQSFEDFITGIARGMGYSIMQREEAMSSKPRLREVSDYKIKYLKEEIDKIRDYLQMTPKQRYQKYLSERRERRQWDAEYEKNKRTLRKRYEDMLEQVQAWEVPEVLETTKEYAIEQLNQSIEFDCSEFNLSFPTYKEWQRVQEDTSRFYRDILNLEEEIERVQQANECIVALYQSL